MALTGLAMMLKTFGIDPEQIAAVGRTAQTEVENLKKSLADISERLNAIDDRLAIIEAGILLLVNPKEKTNGEFPSYAAPRNLAK